VFTKSTILNGTNRISTYQKYTICDNQFKNTDIIGKKYGEGADNYVDNKTLVAVNEIIRTHPVEEIGQFLRSAMADMKTISIG
jgi:hypothetical protein